MDMIAQRGVTARVIGRSKLYVTRRGESFSIDAGMRLACSTSFPAVFLGSCTDRYLAVPTEGGDGGQCFLHVFDLEERTCFQCGEWYHKDYSVDWIHTMVCSDSGRFIAAVVGEGRSQMDSILVASIDCVGRTTSHREHNQLQEQGWTVLR